MANHSTSDLRMLEVIEILKEVGDIEFTVEFCEIAGMQKQNIQRIRSGAASFTGAHIERICKHYNINANFIMDVEPNVFRGQKRNSLTVNRVIARLRNFRAKQSRLIKKQVKPRL